MEFSILFTIHPLAKAKGFLAKFL